MRKPVGLQPLGEADVAAHFRALAADIRDLEGIPMPAAASFLTEIRSATKGRPSPASLGVRSWPGKKVAPCCSPCPPTQHTLQHAAMAACRRQKP